VADTSPSPRDGPIPARRAHAVLALLVACQLVLGLVELRHGLPFVLHADYFQIGQAAQLLEHGWFTDDNVYPLPLIWVYAAAGAAFGVLSGRGAEAFADPVVHHAVGRLVGVLCGALLVVATYRLARERYTRGVALLAAAAIAVDPLLLLAVHQVRPHVPAALLVAVAAPLVLRFALLRWGQLSTRTTRPPRPVRPVRAALLAGALVGLGAAVFQLAALQAPVLLLFVVLGLWPVRHSLPPGAALRAGLSGRTLATLAAAGAAMLGAWGLVTALAHLPEAIRALPQSSALDPHHSAGLVARLLGAPSSGRMLGGASGWLLAAPAIAAGGLLCVGRLVLQTVRPPPPATLTARVAIDADGAHLVSAKQSAGFNDRWLWRHDAPCVHDLVLYGAFPALVLPFTGIFLEGHVRYLLPALPFLAVLAAAGCLAVRPVAVRAACVALLVLVPLACSVRALALLQTVDSRLALDALLSELNAGPEPPLTVALQGALVLDRGALPPGAVEFPAYGDLARWDEAAAPREELRRTGAALYARAPGTHWAAGPLNDASMQWLGFERYGQLGRAAPSRVYLPDVPDALCSELWRAGRTGPPIELWVAGGPAGALARARLARIVAPDALPDWTGPRPAASGCSDAEAAVAAAVERGVQRRVPKAGGGAGSGTGGARVAGVAGAQLDKLLALPADRWRDAGGALAARGEAGAQGAASAPRSPALEARGTLLNQEPVLLLLRGAPPGARCQLVLGARELRSPFRGGLLVPAPDLVIGGLVADADGTLSLAALWPRGTPARTALYAQVWIEDAGGPQGYTATNAMCGVSPE
jgi:hypothetical protein